MCSVQSEWTLRTNSDEVVCVGGDDGGVLLSDGIDPSLPVPVVPIGWLQGGELSAPVLVEEVHVDLPGVLGHATREGDERAERGRSEKNGKEGKIPRRKRKGGSDPYLVSSPLTMNRTKICLSLLWQV